MEEQERIVGDVSKLDDKLDDVVASLEMLELTVSELKRRSAESDGQCATSAADTWLTCGNEALSRVGSVNGEISRLQGLQLAPAVNLLRNCVTLEHVRTERETLKFLRMSNRNRKACCSEIKEQKEGELSGVDVRTADWSEQEEKLQAEDRAACTHLQLSEKTLAALQSAVQEESKSAIHEKFQAGVLLGRKTEEMLTLKQSNSTELSSTEATEAQLAARDKQVLTVAKEDIELSEQLDAVNASTASVLEQISAGSTARNDLRTSLSSMQAEVESTNQLHQNTLLQSFQARADALAEDVLQASTTTAAKKAQLSALEDQVRSILLQSVLLIQMIHETSIALCVQTDYRQVRTRGDRRPGPAAGERTGTGASITQRTRRAHQPAHPPPAGIRDGAQRFAAAYAGKRGAERSSDRCRARCSAAGNHNSAG